VRTIALTSNASGLGFGGKDAWIGIAAIGKKLYCAPHNAQRVLVIDGDSLRTLECGVAGDSKWAGIAAVGSKLYCAPFGASSVLVIDTRTDTVSTIECGVSGVAKWWGIAAVGNKLYCAPNNASSVLVIDADTDTVRTIESGVTGNAKWFGIAAVGNKLYCAPFEASSVLVIDTNTDKVSTIACGIAGNCVKAKWAGIAAVGTKLYCAPRDASSVLVIDADTDTVRTIGCDDACQGKYSGIAAFGSKLYCAPRGASSVLVIDTESSSIRKIECGISGSDKWNGIAASGNSLYCAPMNASSVLVIDTPQRPCFEDLDSGKRIMGTLAEAGVLSERDPVFEVVLNQPLSSKSLKEAAEDDGAAADVEVSLSLFEDEQKLGSEGSAWCDGGRCVVCVNGSGHIDLSSDCLSLRVGDTVKVACQDPLHVSGALGTIASIAGGERAKVKLLQCRHQLMWGKCAECNGLYTREALASLVYRPSAGGTESGVSGGEAAPDVIVVSGGDCGDKKCSGVYKRCGKQRNGGPCYSREGGGAIYYDGVFWKICQSGEGSSENGWNFSQKGASGQVPIGKWDQSLKRNGEATIDYSALSLAVSVGGTESGVSGGEAAPDVIVVLGGVKCSGVYKLCGKQRNGGPCYSRGGGGAIYYDGAFWKICQSGEGSSEVGWNFSQKGASGQVPIGKWDQSLKMNGEYTIDYSTLSLAVSAGGTESGVSGGGSGAPAATGAAFGAFGANTGGAFGAKPAATGGSFGGALGAFGTTTGALGGGGAFGGGGLGASTGGGFGAPAAGGFGAPQPFGQTSTGAAFGAPQTGGFGGGFGGGGFGAAGDISGAPKCPTAQHVMVISVGTYTKFFCNRCRASGSGERWFCGKCKDDFCFKCEPRRASNWQGYAISSLCNFGQAKPTAFGAPTERTFGAAASVIELRVSDLYRVSASSKSVSQAGDRLAFAVSRPWNGQDIELAVLVNGEVVEKMQYVPSGVRNARAVQSSSTAVTAVQRFFDSYAFLSLGTPSSSSVTSVTSVATPGAFGGAPDATTLSSEVQARDSGLDVEAMSILCTHLALLDGKVLSESEAKNAAEFYLKVLWALVSH
jgi:hypothetical protein